MKRGLILVLVLVYALAGTCFAETDVPTTVKAVQEAYYEAINAEGDGDVKYQELHMLAENLKTALSKNDRSAVEDDCVLLYGDFDDFSDEELLQKTDQFLEYVVDADDDKLSALMRKFQTMSSVSGTIEPKSIAIEVSDISEFVDEIGLTPQTVGYLLAMLDVYDYSWLGGDELLQFTDTGFTFNWKAVGAYEMSLTGDTAADTIEELARGCSGDKVVRLQERLNELGFSVGTVDGSYGKKTEFAVRDFQERNGLSVTGIADVDTQELLYSDNALATHFGFTIDEFISRFFETSEKNFRIAEENGSYNVYGYGSIDASFAFETDSLGHVTSISFDGRNIKKNGQNHLYACLYAFGVIHPDLSGKSLVNEFKRICGSGEIVTEDGIEYPYMESSKLNVLWFTMKIKN